MKLIMFQRKTITKQNTPTLLTKPQSSYKKLEKAMNEAPKEYEQIKRLIDNNDIEKIGNKTSKNDLPKFIPHQKIILNIKINIKSKKINF